MNPQMNILPEEWNAIESFLDREPESQKSILNEELDKIPGLDQKIQYIKKVRCEIEDAIRKSKIKEFHDSFNEFERNCKAAKPESRKRRSLVLLYSIAAILIVVFGIFQVFENRKTPESLFADNFKPDIGLPLKMGPAKTYDFYEGMVDYKQENYEEAIKKWEVLLQASPDNDTINYFLGLSHLALGEASQALEYLLDQERFKGGIFETDAAHYAALAKIKEGQFNDARVLLKANPSATNNLLLQKIEKQ